MSCWSLRIWRRRIGVVLSPKPAAPIKWYYRPVWVLVLLFLVLGPFGLPYLWKSPSFSRPLKVLLTLLLLAYMALFIGETIRVIRLVNSVMGTVSDF